MPRTDPVPEMAAVPAEAMLGHVRPRAQFAVRTIRVEETQSGRQEEYHVSGQSVGGSEVFVSLRLLIADAAEPRVTLSLPGGAGAFPEATLPWLARTFGGNHAAIDWVGRGRSPRHDTVSCLYDPIWLGGDSYRDAYLFHNIAAIWAAFDWLHERGFAPDAVVGGSWGAVYSLLLGALDRRVARIYATFGCGGFSIPAIEKRSMWDAAFAQMGPHRTREWCRAFDPLLRAPDIAASVYFETATNDKFFSLDMAMATWHALPKPHFMALRHNQDHTMHPFGQQPYAIDAIDRAGDADALVPATLMKDKRFSFVRDGAEEICWPIDDAEFGSTVLATSEQRATRGDMSRAWRLLAPRIRSNQIAAFPVGQKGVAGATGLFYLTRSFTAGGRVMHAATPVHRRDGTEDHDGTCVQALLPDPAENVWDVPLGDKTSPRASNVGGAFNFAFTGERRQRATRFGIQPWTLPPDWRRIDVTCLAESCNPGELALFLCCRFNRLDEGAVVQNFSDAVAEHRAGGTVYRFARGGFVPRVIIEQRFGPLPVAAPEPVLRGFDAVGVIDLGGLCVGDLRLASIVIQ